MRGKNENLEAKAELAFEGAEEWGLCTNGGRQDVNALSMDEVVFAPPLDVVGGLEGGGGGVASGNNGSNPTGTRFNKCVCLGRKPDLNCG